MIALLPDSAPLVIGPAWTLTYELYFYLVFAVVMLLGPTRGIVALTGIFLISIVLGVVLRAEAPATGLATNSLLLEFIMGVWIARLTSSTVLPKAAGWLALALAIGCYAAGLAWGYNRLPSVIIWGIPSGILIAGAIVLEQRKSVLSLRLFQRLSWLGDSSYSLYLSHMLIISLVMHIRTFQISLLVLVSLTSIISVAFAIMFYDVVERPMTRLLHKSILHQRSEPRISC